jgi:hypothetical protein
MVRMNRSIQSFCSANTCSTRERIFDLALWARRMPSGMARPFGFLWCTRDRKPFFCMRRLRWRLTGGVRPHAACGIALCRKKPLAQLAALVSGGGGLQPNGAAHAIKIRPQRCTGPAIRRASTSTDRENAVDNNAAYKHPKVRQWLAAHPRCWTSNFRPNSCSWLNAIESFFAIVTKRRLKCGVFRSFVDLQVDAYLKAEPDNSDQKDQTTDSCHAPLATPTASRITSQSRRAKDSYNSSRRLSQ